MTGGAAESTPSFADRVYALVRQIPRGSALSYGAVAAILGSQRAARGVGTAQVRSRPTPKCPGGAS